MKFVKIILMQLVALDASFIKRDIGESISVIDGNNFTSTTTIFETTTKIPCDWSWGKRHACAISGFLIGFIGFPLCLSCCGFGSDGIVGGSCASGIQRYNCRFIFQ